MQVSMAIEQFFERLGPIGLFLYSILETLSLFPITEILMLPLSTNQPAYYVFWLATVASLGVVAGIVVVYFLMRVLKAYRIIRWIFRSEEAIARANKLFKENGDKALIVAGLTPLPYSLVLYVSLAAGLSLPKALIGSSVRIMRFYALATVVVFFSNILDPSVFTTASNFFTIVTTVLTLIGIVSFVTYGVKSNKRKK
jgi:membrane protein YqaA with SNARE-associated domain